MLTKSSSSTPYPSYTGVSRFKWVTQPCRNKVFKFYAGCFFCRSPHLLKRGYIRWRLSWSFYASSSLLIEKYCMAISITKLLIEKSSLLLYSCHRNSRMDYFCSFHFFVSCIIIGNSQILVVLDALFVYLIKSFEMQFV